MICCDDNCFANGPQGKLAYARGRGGSGLRAVEPTVCVGVIYTIARDFGAAIGGSSA